MDKELLYEANADLETKPKNRKKIILIVAVSVALGVVVLALAALAFYFLYVRHGDLNPFSNPVEDPGDTYPYIPAPKILKAPLPLLLNLSARLMAMDDEGIDYSVISRQDLL